MLSVLLPEENMKFIKNRSSVVVERILVERCRLVVVLNGYVRYIGHVEDVLFRESARTWITRVRDV